MRFAVLSDVHANLQALEAALAAADDLGAEGILCPGDLVGYGPSPNECVRRLRSAGALSVAGNHDLIALGRLSDDRCIPLAQRSLAWTASVLDYDVREALAALPLVERPAPGVLMAHGTPEDPQEYVTRPDQAAAVLRRVAPEVRVVLVGHTHRWMACGEDGAAEPIAAGSTVDLVDDRRILLNAGSVGQSRDRHARARFMIIDLRRGAATFHDTAYDIRATRTALRRAGLSTRSPHLYSTPARRAAGRLKRRLLGS